MTTFLAILVVAVGLSFGIIGDSFGFIVQHQYFWFLGAVTGAVTVMVSTYE